MATKEQRRRKRRSAPLAASADRSQKERDRFFGGKASPLSGSKSTRGYRSVGKDIRSKAAKAAGTGRSLGKATLRPSEVAEADALDRISDNLTEQNVRSPEPLPEAPVENITDSVMSPVVREAIDAGGVKLGTTDGAQVVDTGVPLEDTELVVKSVTEPPKDPLSDARSVYEGLQDPVDKITERYINKNKTPKTPGVGGVPLPPQMNPKMRPPLPWTGEPDPSYMAPPIADPEKKTERPLLSIEDLEGPDGQKEAYDYPDSLSIEDLEGEEEMQRRFFEEVELAKNKNKNKKTPPTSNRVLSRVYNNLGLPDFYPRPRFSGGDVRRLMPEQIEGQRKLAEGMLQASPSALREAYQNTG